MVIFSCVRAAPSGRGSSSSASGAPSIGFLNDVRCARDPIPSRLTPSPSSCPIFLMCTRLKRHDMLELRRWA